MSASRPTSSLPGADLPASGSGPYYHVADPSERDSISAHGLDWRREQKQNWRHELGLVGDPLYPEGNYLWSDRDEAILTAETESDVWQVDVSGLSLEPDPIREQWQAEPMSR